MKSTSLILFLSVLLTMPAGRFANAAESPRARPAKGSFQPTMDPLTDYACPKWFRDAKFGIWSHWGPQAVPMAGDWYAKHM